MIRIMIDDPGVSWENVPVQFRLTYAGPLLGASRSNTRAKHKHEIRKIFHQQLREIWRVHPQLKNHVDEGPTLFGSPAYLANQYERNGFRFVPLVWEGGFLYSKLEILMLRRSKPQSIVQNGDIDGRLKTLFDALRLPRSQDELGGYVAEDGEDPFFCLLEDDSLITKASIESDYLLEDIGDCDDEHRVRLVITVEVKSSIQRGGGYGTL